MHLSVEASLLAVSETTMIAARRLFPISQRMSCVGCVFLLLFPRCLLYVESMWRRAGGTADGGGVSLTSETGNSITFTTATRVTSFLFRVHAACRNNNNMGDLSRRSSRRPLLLESESTNSLTTFPSPPPSRASPGPSDTSAAIGSLYGLLDHGEAPTIFDEGPSVGIDDPRALSAANHAVLESVIDHHGASNLVKRLSEALAQRDAHITALQRLCEEYKVPKERITDAADRVKQAERRRLSLSAASEDLAPSAGNSSEASVSRRNHHCTRSSC